jgi:hypothetical protein
LPAVATWWCGEPGLEYVFKHTIDWNQTGFPNQRSPLMFGRELSSEQREELFERMRAAAGVCGAGALQSVAGACLASS